MHAKLCPRVEVVRGCHCSTAALLLSNRNVLLEGRSSNNGGLVHLSVLVDIVGASVRRNRALVGATGEARVVFVHVVLHERVGGPSIHSEERRSGLWLERAREVDVPY
jgi:hypothetical protein